MDRFTYSRAPVKRVDSVQFGTLSTLLTGARD